MKVIQYIQARGDLYLPFDFLPNTISEDSSLRSPAPVPKKLEDTELSTLTCNYQNSAEATIKADATEEVSLPIEPVTPHSERTGPCEEEFTCQKRM